MNEDRTPWRRRVARSAVAIATHASGRLARLERAMRGGLTILTYHRVLPEELKRAAVLPELVVSDTDFRRQIESLSRRCECVTMSLGLRRLREQDVRDRPLVAVTLDDGMRDNLIFAQPILHAFGVKATFYAVTQTTLHGGELWHERAARGWRCADDSYRTKAIEFVARASSNTPTRPPNPDMMARIDLGAWMRALKLISTRARDEAIGILPDHATPLVSRPHDGTMTAPELRTLASTGHDIGCHSMTHPIMPVESDEQLVVETRDAKRLLEEAVGVRVTSFCYPNGSIDARVAAAVRAAGFDHAVSTRTGRASTTDDLFALPRISIRSRRVAGIDGSCSERLFRAELALWRGTDAIDAGGAA